MKNRQVPAGRYAVTPLFGSLRLYVADAKGGLRRLAPDGTDPRGGRLPELVDVVAAITEDRIGAALAYSTATGRCWMCGRQLSNETSVARSVGPECVAKLDGLNEDEMDRLGVLCAEAKGLKGAA